MSESIKMLITFAVTLGASLLAKKTGIELDVEETAGLIATVAAFVVGKKYMAKKKAVAEGQKAAAETKAKTAFEIVNGDK